MSASLHFNSLTPLPPGPAGRPGRSRRPRLGVALSSGGAKGLAHIGVIQVLEENGVEVDMVAGTSMGAYVGGLWASGLGGPELADLAATVSEPRHLWSLVDPAFPPRRGFVNGAKILARLRRSLGDRTFSDLEKPFLCVATELNGYVRSVIDEGDVASAILASLAIPGVVSPVEREGIEYIDGGVCEPLPVSALRERGAVDRIIAVNVLPTPAQVRRHRLAREEISPWRRPLAWLNRQLNLFARDNLLDILRGAAMGAQMRLVERSARRADIVIDAVSPVPRWHDYNNHRAYIALGRAAATARLPEIRSLLGISNHPEVNPELEACIAS